MIRKDRYCTYPLKIPKAVTNTIVYASCKNAYPAVVQIIIDILCVTKEEYIKEIPLIEQIKSGINTILIDTSNQILDSSQHSLNGASILPSRSERNHKTNLKKMSEEIKFFQTSILE